jgi:hypothetical protein
MSHIIGSHGAMKLSIERPSFVEDEHLVFLDKLRASGVTNMFGATPYVARAFGTNKKTSSAIVSYWMKTFGSANR